MNKEKLDLDSQNIHNELSQDPKGASFLWHENQQKQIEKAIRKRFKLKEEEVVKLGQGLFEMAIEIDEIFNEIMWLIEDKKLPYKYDKGDKFLVSDKGSEFKIYGGGEFLDLFKDDFENIFEFENGDIDRVLASQEEIVWRFRQYLELLEEIGAIKMPGHKKTDVPKRFPPGWPSE